MSDFLTRRNFLRAGAGVGLAAGMASRGVRAAAQPEEGKPLRVGYIGVGGRGSTLLNQLLRIANEQNVEVVAVCDLDPARRDAAANAIENKTGKRPELSGSHPYDYRSLLEREDIHGVVMATPCYWHSTMYVDAIKRGMPFYGEKPLAITAGGVKAVNDAYKQNPVVMQIGFQWGSHEARRDIIRQVHEGLIGDLLDGSWQRLNGWDGHAGWYADRTMSGDWMLEQAVHEFNLMWMVVQAHPKRCYTVGRSGIIPGRNTTNYYTTILEYGEPHKNLVLHYNHAWIEVPGFQRGGFMANFVGTKGAVNIMDATARLRKKPADGPIDIKGKGPDGDTGEHIANFLAAVRSGKPDATNCGIKNGTGASYIGLMIRQSLEAGRPVTFEEMLRDTRKPPVPPEA